MSIFYSPDEPKEIDKHSGRMTRFSTHSSLSFSREKSNTLSTKPRKLKVIPEVEELKKVRGAYIKFVELFDKLATTNGPEIGGKQLAASYLLYKQEFDSFLIHSAQYYNSFTTTRRVGRYSPLIEFATKLLKEWTTIVIIINKLAATNLIPHLKLIQDNFDKITSNIQQIALSIVSRTYYKDYIYSSSSQLKSEISRVYQLIFQCLSQPDIDIEDESEIEPIRVEMVNLSRNINENFIGLIPSNISNTPELIRIRALLKAACGDIISLVDAGFVFKDQITHLLNRMKTLDNATRSMLDSLGIKYRLEVAPNGEEEESEYDIRGEEDEGEIQVHITKPYYVEVPAPKKPRCTSHLTKKPYRGMSALKKLPEDLRRQKLSHTQDIIELPHSHKPEKKPENFTRSQPPISIDNFVDTISETLGLEISSIMPETEKMQAIQDAIKEKLKNQTSKSKMSVYSSVNSKPKKKSNKVGKATKGKKTIEDKPNEKPNESNEKPSDDKKQNE